MCPSREDREISPSLETTDKRSRALGFNRRLPNSSSNGTSAGEGSKRTKVKSGTTKTSRSGSEGMFGKWLHFKSLSLKRAIFDQFVLEQQKRLREPTSHKLEGSELVHSLQTLEDERFALPEACVANRGLPVQNRPEGWIFQCSFTQRYTKIRTVFLDIELQNVEYMSHTYQIDNIATLSYQPKMGGIKNPELMRISKEILKVSTWVRNHDYCQRI